MIREDVSRFIEPHVKRVDPALLTHKEYLALVDADNKSHPSSAYDVSLEQMNKYAVTDFDTTVQRIKVNGLWFEIKARREKNNYAKYSPQKEILRDEKGMALYFTDDEVVAMGKPLYETSLAIFNEDDKKVADFTDEWGCVLIRVASEYRGFGFGTLLTKLGRTIYPAKTSGGFTHPGKVNFGRVHYEFVRDALKQGRYSRMVRNGELSFERAKAIIESVKLSLPPKIDIDLSSKPEDWLLMADEYGSFILYDKKIKDLSDAPKYEHFYDKMIKGMIYVMAGDEYGIVQTYGGITPKIKAFLIRCAARFCAKNNVEFVVDSEDLSDIPTSYLKVEDKTNKSGMWRHTVTEIPGQELHYEDMAKYEALWRKSFDKHGEFHSNIQELAYGKFS